MKRVLISCIFFSISLFSCKQQPKPINYTWIGQEWIGHFCTCLYCVNGGVKVRRGADQNRGTQILFTASPVGCQTFFIS